MKTSTLASVRPGLPCRDLQSCAAGPGRGGQPPATAREDALDPTPVDAAVDPNIDLFINDWRNAKPRTVYGKLVFRDILTRLDGADPVRPARKGAVLTSITSVSYATLAPGATATRPVAEGRTADLPRHRRRRDRSRSMASPTMSRTASASR